MLQSRLRRQDGRARAIVQSLRLQFAVGLVSAVLLPSLVRGWIDGRSFSRYASSIFAYVYSFNALVASFVAFLLGLAMFRRLCNFPGVRSYEYVLPALSMSYGLIAAVLLAARLEYTVSVLLVSYAVALIAFYFFSFLIRRSAFYIFYVVPGGDLTPLRRIGHVQWIYLRDAELPVVPASGIVVDLRANIAEEWERLLAEAALKGVPVFDSKHLRESLTGQVEVNHISENGFGLLNPNVNYNRLKRGFDVCLSIAVLPIVLPAMAVMALAISLDSAGGVFYKQQRVGFRGKQFVMFKFRTMRRHTGPAEADGRTFAMTRDGDPRVTRVGRWLRRTRMDELPQILNVLRGEMSWIGPRPEALALSEWYRSEISFYSYRHVVRPGITGWAQVNQGHVAELDDVHAKVCYDFYYIKYLSVWLDALILFRTVRTILTGYGAR